MESYIPIMGADTQIEWRSDLNSATWDASLAHLGGHPLQSALFGDARIKVENVSDQRWIALRDGTPLWMIRIELRGVPLVGKLGWAPRGPSGIFPDSIQQVPLYLRQQLKIFGIQLLITDRWEERHIPLRPAAAVRPPRTVWIDLTAGRDVVWSNLSKGWRYGVRNAERKSVVVEVTRSLEDIERFYNLCVGISKTKEFVLPGSLALLTELVENGNRDIEAVLFVARCKGEIASGALVIRCGKSVHYFWGATNRQFRVENAGEAVQWAVIEWALGKGCSLYDLEGVDPVANPGTYAFKKKMGGRDIYLAGKEYFPFDRRGQLFAWIDVRR